MLDLVVDEIGPFEGETRWASNFYSSEINFCHIHLGKTFYAPTVEHAYQASKTNHLSEVEFVLQAETPAEAKRRGRHVSRVPTWDEEFKLAVMYQLVFLKFTTHIHLKEKLLATGDKLIVEKNYWHDNTFGACLCDKCKDKVKLNQLGNILMLVRYVIQTEDFVKNQIKTKFEGIPYQRCW